MTLSGLTLQEDLTLCSLARQLLNAACKDLQLDLPDLLLLPVSLVQWLQHKMAALQCISAFQLSTAHPSLMPNAPSFLEGPTFHHVQYSTSTRQQLTAGHTCLHTQPTPAPCP
jgi:hypothetical protein